MVCVSILVPCYNVQEYLRQCLDSILEQTLKNIEIVCVNDGSTDGTLEILNSYASLDKRIIVISKENSGYGDTMNVALRRAKGEFVGIVESDDFVEPDMFEVLYTQAKKFDLDISRGCYYEYCDGVNSLVSNQWVPKNIVHNPNENQAAFWQAPSIWCSIYRRDWLKQNGIWFLPTPGASYQDTSFAFKCYACCNRFRMLDKPLLHYRLDNSFSSVKSSGKAFCVCDEWEEIYRFVRSNKERFNHLSPLLPLLQFGTYKWNYNRLNGKLKKKFLWVWIKEVVRRFIDGEIPIHKMDFRIGCKIKKLFFNF